MRIWFPINRKHNTQRVSPNSWMAIVVLCRWISPFVQSSFTCWKVWGWLQFFRHCDRATLSECKEGKVKEVAVGVCSQVEKFNSWRRWCSAFNKVFCCCQSVRSAFLNFIRIFLFCTGTISGCSVHLSDLHFKKLDFCLQRYCKFSNMLCSIGMSFLFFGYTVLDQL